MNSGHYVRRSRRRRFDPKKLALLLSVVMLFGAVVGGTVAYLIADNKSVTNTFVPGHVGCAVTNSGNTFTIKPDNETNTNVYIRAAVVANWVKDGNIHWDAPEFTVAGTGWSLNNDGYYYYQTAVAPGGTAGALTVTQTSAGLEGYTFKVEVLAEAIQSAPSGKPAWDNGGMK